MYAFPVEDVSVTVIVLDAEPVPLRSVPGTTSVSPLDGGTVTLIAVVPAKETVVTAFVEPVLAT